MRDWLESNRVGVKTTTVSHVSQTCPRIRIFVETVMFDEDAEHQARLVSAITKELSSARDSRSGGESDLQRYSNDQGNIRYHSILTHAFYITV